MTPDGIDIGDPVGFERVVEYLFTVVGMDWVASRVAELKGAKEAPLLNDDGSRLLAAFVEYPDMLRALQAAKAPRDPTLFLHLGMVAWVVSECSTLPGGKQFTKKLRGLARANSLSAFFDTLFEGEAALYWRSQMTATQVGFPTSDHPDFFATLDLGNHRFVVPNECKRIAPIEKRESDVEKLAARLDDQLNPWVANHAPIKVIVWLHREASHISETDVMGLIVKLATSSLDGSKDGRWLTASESTGLFQVSVADAGEAGELKERPIAIGDVPAVGSLRVRAETVYLGKQQDPVKLKYVLSVRSDVVPNRIGALERNLNKAISQVAVSTTKGPGVVNVRLRPPRDLGDLYEADLIVRRVLRSLDATHIALVVLFWNEGERDEGEWRQVENGPQRDVTVKHGLVPYFIAHGASPIDFSPIDSLNQRFVSTSATIIRNPETGSIVPVDPQLFEQIERAPNAEGKATETETPRSAWMHLNLARPFPEGITRQAVQAIKAEGRVFVPIFDDQQHVRFVEFVGRQPVRVATLDLRAWLGQTELLFTLRWDGDAWNVSALTADETARVVASSSPLRQVFA